jgi:hypothetical protein
LIIVLVIILSEEYKLRSFSLYSFLSLLLFHPSWVQILTSAHSSQTPSQAMFLPHKTTCKIGLGFQTADKRNGNEMTELLWITDFQRSGRVVADLNVLFPYSSSIPVAHTWSKAHMLNASFHTK